MCKSGRSRGSSFPKRRVRLLFPYITDEDFVRDLEDIVLELFTGKRVHDVVDEPGVVVAHAEKVLDALLPAGIIIFILPDVTKLHTEPFIQQCIFIAVVIIKRIRTDAGSFDERRYGDLIECHFLEHLFKSAHDRAFGQ